MKTEKKPNEPSCCPPTAVVKDEPDTDPVKIKDENTGTNDDTTGEDTAECPRDPCLDPTKFEGESQCGAMSVENPSTNGNQSILTSIKQEGDLNNPTDELPGTTPVYFCNFIICESSVVLLYTFFFRSRISLIKLFFLL